MTKVLRLLSGVDHSLYIYIYIYIYYIYESLHIVNNPIKLSNNVNGIFNPCFTLAMHNLVILHALLYLATATIT